MAEGRPSPPDPTPPETAGSPAVIGARLAWAVLVVELVAYATWGIIGGLFVERDGPGALLAVSYVLTVALQLRHSAAARNGRRPPAWPVTLGAQAALAYVFFLPPVSAYMDLAPFLAASVLLLVPGRWRWAGYAAVVASWSALYHAVPCMA